MNFIKEMYFGNISPGDQRVVKNSEYARLSSSCEKLYSALKQKLSDDDIEKLDKLSDSNFELSALTAEENYVLGFRDGAKMMLDVLTGENENLRYLTK